MSFKLIENHRARFISRYNFASYLAPENKDRLALPYLCLVARIGALGHGQAQLLYGEDIKWLELVLKGSC